MENGRAIQNLLMRPSAPRTACWGLLRRPYLWQSGDIQFYFSQQKTCCFKFPTTGSLFKCWHGLNIGCCGSSLASWTPIISNSTAVRSDTGIFLCYFHLFTRKDACLKQLESPTQFLNTSQACDILLRTSTILHKIPCLVNIFVECDQHFCEPCLIKKTMGFTCGSVGGLVGRSFMN